MPRKEFESFTRLDASSINTFLMDQSVQSFADSTARASAITTPVEGMVTYLNDIDSLSVYNGSDWTTDRTIQVFAGTAARGSAIPSPVEGMYTHINETDSLEYYDGSAWEGVGGGGGAMDLITTENFSAVSEVLFTSRFTSVYRNYFFIISSLSASVNNGNLLLQLRNATSNQTSANYQRQFLTVQSTTVTGAQATNQTSIRVCASETLGRIAKCYIFDPLGNSNTSFQADSNRVGTTNQTIGFSYGNYNANYSADGFRLFPESGTITGTISLYGIKE
jgi:hypothetical protein